jgi:hypothetical protein
MLYREIIAVCSQIHTQHINTVCGQNVGFVNVKLAVNMVTTGLQRVKQEIRVLCFGQANWIVKSKRNQLTRKQDFFNVLVAAAAPGRPYLPFV